MFQMLYNVCTKQYQNIKKIKLKEDVSVYNYFNKKISGNKELIFFIEYSSFSCLVRKNLVHPVHSFVTFISKKLRYPLICTKNVCIYIDMYASRKYISLYID